MARAPIDPKERARLDRLDRDITDLHMRILEGKQRIGITEQDMRTLEKNIRPEEIAKRQKRVAKLKERLSVKKTYTDETKAAQSSIGLVLNADIDVLEKEIEALEVDRDKAADMMQNSRIKLRMEQQSLDRLYGALGKMRLERTRLSAKLGLEAKED